MKISVAMATHDGQRYLDAQLRSLARQTRPPDELVVCDDASSDGTGAILTGFARAAPFPVRVLKEPRRIGPHEAFLRAAGACASQAVAFCDQDDIWLEPKLERCAEALADGVLLVVHSASVVRHDLAPTGRRLPPVGRRRVVEPGGLDPALTLPGFALVFDRSLLAWGDWCGRPGSRFWPGPMSHDEWVGVLASAAGATVLLPQVLALYRQHPGQLFGAGRRGPRETIARLVAEPPEACEQVAELREEHARYLRRLAGAAVDREPRLAANLRRSAQKLDASADLWRARAELRRRTAGRAPRMRGLVALAGQGGYRPPGSGGLGAGALVRDALAAGLG